MIWFRQQRKAEAKPQPAPSEGPAEKPPVPAPPTTGKRPAPDALRDRYLRDLVGRCAGLKMTTIDTKAATRQEAAELSLAAVFTDLDIHDVWQEQDMARKRGEPGPELARGERRIPGLTALSRYPRLVLLGDPGSGKSTLVNFVTLCLAGDWLNDPNTTDADLRRLGEAWQLGRLLPIRVILRDYAARGLPGDQGLWAFIGQELAQVETRDGPLSDCLPVLESYLERKDGAILLLDGVDEAPEAHRYRLRLKTAVEQFSHDFPHCRILLTSRPYAYQDPGARLSNFDARTLLPFTPEQVQAFIHRWYEHVGLKDPSLGPENAARYAEQLSHAVESNPRMADLAPNPLLLTLMVSLHRWREGGGLPEKRQELYERSVELLLDLWQRPKQLFDALGNPVAKEYDVFTELGVPQDKLRAALNQVAYEAHRHQPELTGTHDIRARDLAGLLYEASSDKGKAQGEHRVIQYLINRAGLLVEREQGRVYTFPHRTFQEYLAACHLADEDYPYLLAERLRDDDARWREATMLAAVKMSGSIYHLLDVFCPRDWPPPPEKPATDADWYGALRAAQALIETEKHHQMPERERPRELLGRLRTWLAALLGGGHLPPPERAAAGHALARLPGGDPRPGVGVDPATGLPALQWCAVPRGRFIMGSRKEDDPPFTVDGFEIPPDPLAYGDEKPIHLHDLPHDYWIARYPVTNAQFRAFVDDPDGYRRDDWWTRAGLAWREDRTRPEMYGGVFDLPNHPAVLITWYEAWAYCRWLTHEMREAGRIPTGWEIRLPSEAEWEKAARGGLEVPTSHLIVGDLQSPIPNIQSPILNPRPARVYPWEGDLDPDRANYDQTGIGAASAVGIFPAGASPYGCLGLSGNVWEWCATAWVDNYRDYGRNEADLNDPGGDPRRVVRGGSYFFNRRDVRCAYRNRDVPGYFLRIQGFRPVAAPVRR